MFPRFFGTSRFDIVEVPIPANATKDDYPFPDQPQLRTDQTQDIIIQAIDCYTVLDASVSNTGGTMPTAAQFIKASVTFYVEGEESLFGIPLSQLHRFSGTVVPSVFDIPTFDNVQIDWQKSFVTTPGGYGGNAAFVFQFGIHYVKYPPGTWYKMQQIRARQLAKLQY